MIELWVEKSTMDDELIPLCSRLGVNLITSTGFQSVTGAINLYSRAAEFAATGKPVRIFYLSDFDPAGDSMPVAVSRQIEFWHQQFGDGVDIKLTPVALTKAQVEHYELPTIPIKDSDKRKDAFTDRHDVDGAVELDALEAIHPGELSNLIHDAISQYIDDEVELELTDAGSEAEDMVSDVLEDYLSDYQLEAEEIERRANEVANRFAPKLKALSEEFNAEMATIRSEAEELEARIQDAIQGCPMHIELPHRPVPSVDPPDESKWLYASDRTFGKQLQRYKSHKDGR